MLLIRNPEQREKIKRKTPKNNSPKIQGDLIFRLLPVKKMTMEELSFQVDHFLHHLIDSGDNF